MKKPYVPPEIEIRRIAFEETISSSANDTIFETTDTFETAYAIRRLKLAINW